MRKNPASTSISAQRPKPAVAVSSCTVAARTTVPRAAEPGAGHRRREAVEDAEAVHEALRLVAGGGEPVGHLLVSEDDGAAPGQRPAPGQQCVDGVGDVVQGLEDDHGVERSVVGDCRRWQGLKRDVDAGRCGVDAGIIDRRGVVSKPTMSACRERREGYGQAPSLPASDVGDPSARACVAEAGPISVASSQSARALV